MSMSQWDVWRTTHTWLHWLAWLSQEPPYPHNQNEEMDREVNILLEATPPIIDKVTIQAKPF